MPCQGYHIRARSTVYCLRLPDIPLSPGQRDTVLAEAHRWMELGPWVNHCDSSDIEDITDESGFAYEVGTTFTHEAGSLLLSFSVPLRSQPAGKVQHLKIEVSRELRAPPQDQNDADAPKCDSGQPAGTSSSKFDAKGNDNGTTSKPKTRDKQKPQMLVTPIGCSDAGPAAVKLGDTLISLSNKHLKAALMDPDLGAELPPGDDCAYQSLQRGEAILVDWHEPPEEIDPKGTIHTEWTRMVPRVKPQDRVYFVSEETDSLTSRLSDADAAKRYKEPFTVTQTAILFEEQREELQRAFLAQGWPCKVIEGKIVIELFGKTLYLDQQHITPKPLASGSNARLVLLWIGGGVEQAKCQPMACSPEASWIMNRYEVHFKTKTATHRFQPYSAHINSDWEQLFHPMAEAMTVSLGGRDEGRLVYHHQYANRPKNDVVGGVAVRLRDGGSRVPVQLKGGGWGEYFLPGDPDIHSWGSRVKTPVDYTLPGSMKASVRGPSFFKPGPWDIILHASNPDVVAGLDFGVCPRNQPGRIYVKVAKVRDETLPDARFRKAEYRTRC